ncbi:hybrid sensor histidine kinase/response regulator [uncultured Methanoregula sp.]|uniref:hybrid sensor histidine kinase/response regulator n=1 Tax=uncultured Methanoregula sp. TaxID=1005933 RepID=UPI002AAB2654|nr:hybrid sensor histidine kinase/response regulator [uncultured Methanoregula sp.]
MNGPDAEFEKRLLATFRDEAEEHLGVMVALLLELESAGSAADPGVIERIYRTTHSLKGAARAVSQKEIESVCQNLENVFSRMKKGMFVPDAEAFDLFFQAIKIVQALLAGKKTPDISPVGIVTSLRALTAKESVGSSTAAGREPACGSRSPATPLPLRTDTGQPRKPQEVLPPAGTPQHRTDNPLQKNSGQEVFLPPINAGIPARPASDGGTVRIAAHKLDRLIVGSDDLLTTRLFITHRMRELEEMIGRFSHWKWNQTLISSDLYLIRETLSGIRPTNIPPELIPPIQRLVEFMDYDREFVTHLQHDLSAHIRATERDRSALEASTSEISDLIHDAVLLPVSSILTSFPGLVREYSRTTGKQVELVTEGDEIEVDRRILDALKDPLMHLIYNSIDHGVEYPDIRAARNKPSRGRVLIKVFPLSGGKVGIEVSDDGAGIDGSAIRKTAIRTGLITEREEARLTDAEAVWLIFRSGLSTSQNVTEISGRGLGLAIVEDTVTRLGGYVTVSSGIGKGTSIIMRVPVRLVTFRGIVVRSGNRMYVLPMQQVRQVLRIKADTIVHQGSRPVLSLQNETIGVVHLSEILSIPRPGVSPGGDVPVSIVIIAYGAGQVACIVDEVIRVQEIVVRPLGNQLRRVRRIAGAAILGDGTIALVLDTPELIQEALKTAGTPAPVAHADPSAPRILVVEDSVTSRTFLQMILEQDGCQVRTATDGIQAFGMLKEHRFDMVVSDVDMPRMNGFTLTEKIRADSRLSTLPVILVTSLDSPEDKEHGLAIGADAYVIKSGFEKNNLRTIVRDLLKKTRSPGR